ncbi:hypothetical protein SUGI_0346060 [Cryptomeria japonica]|nr:hypothetical protein SUGI_0346060 [Cryptomeria japonica]
MGLTPATIIGYKIQDEGFISPVTVAPLPLQMVHDLQLYDPSMFHVFSMVSYGSSVLVVATFLERPSAVNIRRVGQTQNHPLAMSMFHDELKQRGIVIWELFPDQEDKLVWKWKEYLHTRSLNILMKCSIHG